MTRVYRIDYTGQPRYVLERDGDARLVEGDVFGQSSGIGPLTAGDTVTIKAEGVGELTNPVQESGALQDRVKKAGAVRQRWRIGAAAAGDACRAFFDLTLRAGRIAPWARCGPPLRHSGPR